jgi:hypothetical protein
MFTPPNQTLAQLNSPLSLREFRTVRVLSHAEFPAASVRGPHPLNAKSIKSFKLLNLRKSGRVCGGLF